MFGILSLRVNKWIINKLSFGRPVGLSISGLVSLSVNQSLMQGQDFTAKNSKASVRLMNF